MKKAKVQNSLSICRARVSTERFFLVASCLIAVFTTACQKAEWREVTAPNTGDVAAEVKTGDLGNSTPRSGQPGYVVPSRLRARTTIEQNPEEATVLIERGNKIEIVDPVPQGPVSQGKDKLVSVRIVEPPPLPGSPKIVFVPQHYLNSEPIEFTAEEAAADRFVVIQNIATEKLRVYEISKTPDSPNKLILETDMIAGENDPAKTKRTALGSYRILSWHKYYQDHQSLFPSWFDPSSPDLPLPGASLQDWTQRHFLPLKGPGSQGLIRGAFGWYTAKIGPNAFAQWTHGTLGWGADGDRFIQLPKSQLTQFYSDPRGFGCTRIENQAIAFLHDLLPVGTRIIKVYAREAQSDVKAPVSQLTSWEWILTKEDVRSSNPNSSNRPAVLLRDVPSENVLESGTFQIDVLAKPVEFKKTVKGQRLSVEVIRPEANLYDLPEAAFRGEFLVNEGRLSNYSHPKQLRKGGYTDALLPRAVVK